VPAGVGGGGDKDGAGTGVATTHAVEAMEPLGDVLPAGQAVHVMDPVAAW